MPMTIDEWINIHYPAYLTTEHLADARTRVDELPDLIGPVPAPLVELLHSLLDDPMAGARVYRWLVAVDAQ